jgi:DNA-binding phage protein
MKPKFRPFTQLLDEYLRNPDFALEFLNQAFADEDLASFQQSLKEVTRIQGSLTELVKKTQICPGMRPPQSSKIKKNKGLSQIY